MKREIRSLAQADLLLLIADLFRPPEKVRHSLDALRKPNLKMLLTATELPGREALCNQLHKAVGLARRASKDEWAACYRMLFDGSIVCPINEAGYIRRDKGAIIGDVCGFYRAFGWTTVDKTGERPDHLLVELEFAAMLLVMIARAESKEQRKLTETALADFARHHLSDWLPAFAGQLKLSTSWPLFVESANLLGLAWSRLVEFHKWTVDPAPLTIGIGDEPESPYECGAPDLVTLQTNNITK